MIPANVAHIFFDLDHTLWDFDANSQKAFEQILATAPFKVNVADFLKVYEPINSNYWSRYRLGEIDHTVLRYGRFESTLQALEIAYQPQWVTELAHGYLEELPKNNALIDGAEEVLQRLQSEYQLHIITNGFSKVQQNKIEASGIRSYFATITDSEASGYKKPQPEIFAHALQKVGCAAHQSLMVGDDVEADVHGAQRVGMYAVLFDRYDVHNDVEVPRITTLKALYL